MLELNSDLLMGFKKFVLHGPDCWYWTGYKMPSGYGKFNFKGKNYLAHRIAFFIAYEYLDDELFVMHTCDHKWCVNPSHLSQGTNTDNMQDCKSKNRHIHGQNHPEALLKDDDVIQIRARYKRGAKVTYLAKHFHVSHALISRIVHYKAWKHLP